MNCLIETLVRIVVDFPDHHMATNVVKKRIVTRHGAADYTGPVNASGQPHGYGSYEVVNGKNKGCTYEGQLNNGSREGFGKLTIHGYVWQGEFKEDTIDGFATVVLLRCDLNHFLQFTNAGGDVLEGLYEDGERHGLRTV